MTPAAPARERSVRIRRMFANPRDEVFAAWTDPQAIESWFGGPRAEVLSAVVDLEVGGRYRLDIRAAGLVFALEGTYREVEPPERLVYTWRWEGLDVDEGRESLVTVEFRDRHGATELVLTHEGVDSPRSFSFHLRGWRDSLDALGGILASRG